MKFSQFFKNKTFFVVLLFSVVSCVVTYSWFSSGKMLAGAEEGIPFYNPSRTLQLYSSIWFDADLGVAVPVNIIRVPFYMFAAFLQNIGLPSVTIQIGVFFILLFTGLFSVFQFSRELFKENPLLVHLCVALFYLFNLYSLSQVWARFLYPQFFLWAYFPLFLFLWVRWIKTAKIIYLAVLVLTSFVFSSMFVILSSLFVLWVSAALYIFTYITRANYKTVFYRGILAFVIWAISNTWWLVPIYFLQDNSYGNLLQSDMNIEAVKSVSEYYPLNSVAILQQNYYFGEHGFWKDYYSGINLNSLAYLIFVVACIGAATAKKTREIWFIMVLLGAGWFIAKGANPPFGLEFFSWLFTSLPITQVLRNPYEKFGLVYLLGYAFLFSFGFYYVTLGFKKLQFVTYIFMFYFAFYLMVLPMWDGSAVSRFRVTVPAYYSDANAYINGKDFEGRILQLPYLRGSDIKYTWGYRGNEPSEFLFDSPSVSKTYSLADIDDFYLNIPRYISNPNFPNILAVTNIRWIVLHGDVVPSGYYQETTSDTEKLIHTWGGVQKVAEFESLKVYQIDQKNILDRIYIVSKIRESQDMNDTVDKIMKNDVDIQNEVVVAKSQNGKITYVSTEIIPQYEYRKINNQHYKLSILNAQEAFVLVFTNNFNTKWHAIINGEIETNHIKVNGFANGWIIDKKGDYSIDLMFIVYPWEYIFLPQLNTS